jgi:hypothetical protein
MEGADHVMLRETMRGCLIWGFSAGLFLLIVVGLAGLWVYLTP